jgi:hypothetical protein
MTRRASFPKTDEPTGDFAAAAEKTARHAEMLAEKDRGIHKVATTPPGRDASTMNADRAKREGWTRTPGPSHTPGQYAWVLKSGHLHVPGQAWPPPHARSCRRPQRFDPS